jgi:predicted site-specific integrase-resolvase
MTLEQLMKKTTLYKVSKALGVTPPAIYKWKKTGKIPELRMFQLKEKMPELFEEKQ